MKEVAKHHRMLAFPNAYGVEEPWLAIDVAYVETGIKYAEANQCKRILFGSLEDSGKAVKVGMDVLRRLDNLEGLIWQLPVPKGTDLSVLELHRQLKYLSIPDPNLTIDLSQFPALEHFEFSQAAKVSGFDAASKALRSIVVKGLATSLAFLGSLKGLKELDLLRAGVASLDGVEKLSNLEKLSLISCSKQSDISQAASLKHLHSLTIDGAPLLVDLGGLQKFGCLKTLWFKSKKIESCAFIAKMKSIEFASINAEIMDNDLSPLLNSKTLAEVWFSPMKRTYVPQQTPDEINEVLRGRRPDSGLRA